jgi:AcrR family transcriptional regulator
MHHESSNGSLEGQGEAVSQAALHSVSAGRRGKLPRGPHALPQEIVIADQRARLLEATAAAMAEIGYSELTVRDLIERAGVSRRTFYQLFDDKLACVLAAHESAVESFMDVVGEACAHQLSWPDGVAAGVSAAIDFTVESPDVVRLILMQCHTVPEPRLIEATLSAHERFTAMLRTGRKRSRGPRPALELSEAAIVGGVTAIVGAKLCAGEVEELRGLGPELVHLVLAPYLGEEEAQRLAAA